MAKSVQILFLGVCLTFPLFGSLCSGSDCALKITSVIQHFSCDDRFGEMGKTYTTGSIQVETQLLEQKTGYHNGNISFILSLLFPIHIVYSNYQSTQLGMLELGHQRNNIIALSEGHQN